VSCPGLLAVPLRRLCGWTPPRPAVVAPCTGLMAYARCRARSLSYGRLLDEGLRLVVQVACLRRQGFGHGPEQCCHCDELLTRPGRCVQVDDVEVSVDVLMVLPT
jgi:hypothetical protein